MYGKIKATFKIGGDSNDYVFKIKKYLRHKAMLNSFMYKYNAENYLIKEII